MGGDFTWLAGQTWPYLGRLKADGALDGSFNAGANGPVGSVALDAEGKILVGGNFTQLGGAARSLLGRLNADGTADTTFNPGASGGYGAGVSSLIVQPDSKILVGGIFNTLAGQAQRGVGRLNADGTLDTNFTSVVDVNVYSLALQPDGKIVVGGDFTTLGGATRIHIGRLKADGTLDSEFNPGAEGDYSGVYCLAIQADGKILVGGRFTTLGGQPRTNIGRLNSNGTLDSLFNPGADYDVMSMAQQADGKIMVAGAFYTLGGQPRLGIGRLYGDGTVDSAFDPGAGGVNALALQADGKVLVGGIFNMLGGLNRSCLGRLYNTEPATQSLSYIGSTITWLLGGTAPEAWRTTFGCSTNGSDWLNLGAGERISGGWQLTGVSVASNSTFRALGFVAAGEQNSTSWPVETMIGPPGISVQPCGKFVNAGQTAEFDVTAGGTAPLSYQWRKDGAPLDGATAASLELINVPLAAAGGYDVLVSNAFGCVTSTVAKLVVITPDALDPAANGFINTTVLQRDGRIVLGGSFTALAGQTHKYIGRLNPDGTLDATFGAAASNTVCTLAMQPDGKILVGGMFTGLGGQACKYIGRLNADGTLDAAFNPGASNTVRCLAVQADLKIVVGGDFTSLGGQPRNYIARLNADGTLDGSFNPGAGSSVYSLALQADGKILAGGFFSTLGGQKRNRIGRLNAEGTADASFDPGASATVYCLAVQGDGRIVAGGSFTTIGGQARNYIARLNTDGTLDLAFNPGANGGVNSLALQADGRVLAGGMFSTLGGQTRSYLGRLTADGALDGSFNPGAGSTVLSLALQEDGMVLVGGQFTTLCGQTRTNLGRLNNTEPATQDLAFDGSSVTWHRGGTCPDVWHTSFDASTNGTDWLSLGAGTRITNGWQVTNLFLPTNTTIRARGSVAGGYASSSGWLVETSLGSAAVTAQPVSRTNNAATAATFNVVGAGIAPLAYQWFRNGTILSNGDNVSGAETSVLTLSTVLGGDAGGYSVVISNAYGAIISQVATLTVVDPIIALQPVSQVTTAGLTVVFGVTAAGTEPFSYQWRRNGVSLPGATASSLILTNVQWADGGNYEVLVSNAYGSSTSAAAALAFPASLDTLNLAPNGPVYALAVQTDGKILVGGDFWGLGGQGRYNLGRALPDGTLDTAFNPNVGDSVYSLAVQTDGRILLGGIFSTVGGQVRPYLGRINADGSLDVAFNPSPNSNVNSVAVQPDGKILIGGAFTNLCGQARGFIGRLSAEGTLDAAFNAAASGIIYSMAVQPDGKVLVGGAFTNLCGQGRMYVGRLNVEGTLDATFSPGANTNVYCLLAQPDGKILVGGAFTSLCGQTRMYIARLNGDGTLDTSFNPAASSLVYSLALQADGKILVGGNFTVIGGQIRKYIARLNPDGTPDTTLNPGANGVVYALSLQADGKILAGGNFTTVGGQSRSRLARLNNTYPATQELGYDGANITWLRNGTSPELWRTTFEASANGNSWISLGSGVAVPAGWQLSADSVPAGSTIFARGSVAAGYEGGSSWFVEAGQGPPAIRTQPASRTNNATSLATFSVVAAGAQPLDCQWFKDGVALSDGGNISGARSSSLAVRNVLGADAARYWVVITNAYGSVTSLVATLSTVDPYLSNQPRSRTNNAGTTATFTAPVAGTAPLTWQWHKGAAVLDDGGNISGAYTATLTLSNVLGGEMGGYWATASNSLGSVTSAVATLSVADPCVTSQPASQKVSPGQTASFSVAAAGTAPSYQWRKSGVPLPGATTTTLVVTNAQRPDAGLYEVLIDSSFGSVTSAVAMLTVNLATVDSFNPGANVSVQTVAVQADGKILVGGNFSTLGAQPRTCMGRLNADGTLDSAFAPSAVGNDGVYCFAVQPDNRILVGGAFLSLAGQSQPFYGRLNYDGTLDAPFTLGANGWVSCLLPQADGKTLISGGFTTVGGQTRYTIARLNADGTLDPDFKPDANYIVLLLAAQPNGKILACGGFTNLDGQARSHIGRLNADGSLDTGFNPDADGMVYCLALQTDGKILVGGAFTNLCGQARSYIGRLNSDGTLDNAFNPGANDVVKALAIQTDGTILAGGNFTMLGGQARSRLGRLNLDGSLDSTFDPAADNTVNTFAVQPDGRILVGGLFATLGGQLRVDLGRLGNPDSAGQMLTFDGSNITWLRSGSGPEVWRTSFETSRDGTNWVSAGQGTRIPGGWQVTNVSVPPDYTIRARGFVAGAGYYNGSSWFVESRVQLRPELSAAGCCSNQFWFNISAVPGQAVVIEASTNLAQWIPVLTNVMTSGGVVLFGDPESGWRARRFYRARYYEGTLPPPGS